MAYASKIIFMDEPTAALGVVQRERVLDNIRRVRDRGIAVVLISHNMPEVLAVADRVEVLRMGRRVARFRAADTGVEQLVGAMTGALTTEDEGEPASNGGNGGATAGPATAGPVTAGEARHDRHQRPGGRHRRRRDPPRPARNRSALGHSAADTDRERVVDLHRADRADGRVHRLRRASS